MTEAERPFQVLGIDHVVIRVRDLEPMLRFYRDVLGCAVERVLPEEVGLVQLRAGRSLIDLATVQGAVGRRGGDPPRPEGGHNMEHLCLRIEPFEAEALEAHLRRHGFDTGPVELRYGADGTGPSLYLEDPEGNTVELKGPPEIGPLREEVGGE